MPENCNLSAYICCSTDLAIIVHPYDAREYKGGIRIRRRLGWVTTTHSRWDRSPTRHIDLVPGLARILLNYMTGVDGLRGIVVIRS